MFIEFGKADKWLCNHPTRAFKKLRGNDFLYGIKDSVEVQYRIYNPVIRKSDVFANHKSKSEDFIWNEALGLLKSEGTQILQFNQKRKSLDPII